MVVLVRGDIANREQFSHFWYFLRLAGKWSPATPFMVLAHEKMCAERSSTGKLTIGDEPSYLPSFPKVSVLLIASFGLSRQA
jgi:hypothetical protein